MEGVIHVGLKGGQRVTESEEHDGGFVESKRGGEGGFPLVFRSDEDVIISPSYVEFGEDFAVL